jgi:hypothetical protein
VFLDVHYCVFKKSRRLTGGVDDCSQAPREAVPSFSKTRNCLKRQLITALTALLF